MGKGMMRIVNRDRLKGQPKSVAEQLADYGFSVTQNGDDAFTIKSNATGATVNAEATGEDLTKYLTGLKYVKGRQHRDMNTYKNISSVHA